MNKRQPNFLAKKERKSNFSWHFSMNFTTENQASNAITKMVLLKNEWMSEKKWKIESEMCNVSKNVQKAKTNLDIFCLYKLSLFGCLSRSRNIWQDIIWPVYDDFATEKYASSVLEGYTSGTSSSLYCFCFCLWGCSILVLFNKRTDSNKMSKVLLLRQPIYF